jgi:hypothetical protein
MTVTSHAKDYIIWLEKPEKGFETICKIGIDKYLERVSEKFLYVIWIQKRTILIETHKYYLNLSKKWFFTGMYFEQVERNACVMKGCV